MTLSLKLEFVLFIAYNVLHSDPSIHSIEEQMIRASAYTCLLDYNSNI